MFLSSRSHGTAEVRQAVMKVGIDYWQKSDLQTTTMSSNSCVELDGNVEYTRLLAGVVPGGLYVAACELASRRRGRRDANVGEV